MSAEKYVKQIEKLKTENARLLRMIAYIENDCNAILQFDENDAVCEFAGDIIEIIEEAEIESQEAGNWESK